MFKCKICHNTYSDNAKGSHLRVHKITAKEYYDAFLKKSGEGICKVCGKPTSWNKEGSYYSTYCSMKCSYKGNNGKRIKTTIKRFGVPCSLMSSSVKKKIKSTCVRKYGVTNPNKIKEVRDKIKNTCIEKYGAENYLVSTEGKKVVSKVFNDKFGVNRPIQNESIKKKMKNTLICKYGVDNISKLEEIKKKKETTCFRNYGVKSPLKDKGIRDKIKNTCLKKYGVFNPSQNKEIHKKQFSNKRKEHNGYLSNSEYEFSMLLKNKGIKFKSEYFVENKVNQHHFDFAIFKNNKLNCLVEIDGEYYHCLLSDCDGVHSISSKDYNRWNLVPNKTKFLVIDSKRLKEGIEELARILPMSYKKWKKEMIESIPKKIEDAIPKFSESRMKEDWKRLCTNKYNKNAFLGKSILLNFCHSHWDNFDWKSIRKTLYKSPCSSHHLLEGLDSFSNVSKLREKFRKKYEGLDEVNVKHHSPEKMLAICSLGKRYITEEPMDKESLNIKKFLGII